jgi:excisionase family DNA binding protein
MTIQKVEIPELLTVKEVAQLLRCSLARVYTMVENGDLPHIRFGQRGIRFRADQIQSVLGGAKDEG